MQKGRILALITAASLFLGAPGVQAWTAGREWAPQNLPVLLKHGTLYMTADTRMTTASPAVDEAGRGLYVVQFTGRVLAAYKSALTRLGADVGDYLPENAFLVRMAAPVAQQVRDLGFVKGVATYTPEFKLDRDLLTLVGSDQALVRINTFDTGTKGPVTALSALGIRPEAIGVGVLTAQVDRTRLQSLLANPEVVWVEPVRKNQLFNDKAAGIMGVSSVWGAGLDGKGQIVAITDTGLDTGKNDSSLHPDFQGQVKAIYALGKPGDASDTLAHGTHVAGSILGTGAASNGLYKGMAPGAKLVFEAVEDRQGGLGGIPEDLGRLFKQAYADGARIHSNSWGVPASSGGTVYDAQSAAVDRFMWENPDYTILFAAGNDGDPNQDGRINYGTVSTPGTAKNAITVGASQNDRPGKKMATDTGAMASFSSRGPTGDNRVKPDVVSPGTWIASTRSSLGSDKEFWAPHESNNRYGYMGGTSMATPLTAGATTLVRQYYVDKFGITPRASLLKATLINGAAAMDQDLTWKDNGWGRVDVKNSLYGRPFKYVNEAKALQTGDGQSYTYDVKQGQPLKVTLVWTDFAASPAAAKTLVNDLDLTVTAPDGTVVTGNHMLGGTVDHTNNVENVVLPAPKDGTYTVTVKGYNVPQGPQRFSLVVAGNVDGGAGQPAPPPTDPNPNPPSGDQQPPKVTIASPAEGATVSGAVTVTSEATDNVGVSKVLLFADSQYVGMTTAAPYRVTWDTTHLTPGAYTLVANAYDAAGNVGISPAVHVTVGDGITTGVQSLQFTGQVGMYGTGNRYFVDVAAGGKVQADLGLTGTASVALTALDAQGHRVATGTSSLAFSATASGTYVIVVTSLGGTADYVLKVTYPPLPGTGMLNKSGNLSATGQRYEVIPITLKRAGSVDAAVNFSERRADLDLYLVDGLGRIMARAISPNLNPETVSAFLPAGTYSLYVVVDSGKSDYRLTVSYPK